MNISYEEILNELYELDPNLRTHEDKLKIILHQLLIHKPDIEINEQFKQELKKELLLRAKNLIIGTKNINNTLMSNFSFSNLLRSFSFTAAGLSLLIVVVAGGLYFSFSQQRVAGTRLSLGTKPEIVSVSDRAFGKLVNQNINGEMTQNLAVGEEKINSVSSVTVGSASTEAPAVIADSKMAAPGFGGGGGLIMPNPYSVSYVYKGEPLELDTQEIGVLRRIKNNTSASQLGSLLRNIDFGFLDVSKFTNIELQNLSFIENKDFGYGIYANLYDNSISISENWLKWPNPTSACQDQACFDSFRLSINDIPADEEVIAIANDFMQTYGVNLSGYGEPFVSNEWRVWYDQAENKNDAYVPDVLQVTYPLQIDGSDVYDDSGNKNGLVINVNVRYKKVSGLWNLMAQNYEKSMYEAETNAEAILKIAQRGGVYGWQWEGGSTVEVSLGTPTLHYIRMWNYQTGMIESDELYVPALVFPIIDNPNNADIYRKAVVVPLAKDLLQVDVGVPMPLAEPAVLRIAE